MPSYLGGIIGTIVMTMMILYGDKMGLMPSGYNMITDGLGKMINRFMKLPTSMGWVAHILIGVLVHPLLHELIFVNALGLTGIVWAIVFALIFGVMMVLMLPLLEAPPEWRAKMSMGILMAHLFYGIIFALDFWAF